MLNELLKLVRSFDNEDGLPEATYEATYSLVEQVMGSHSATVFSNHIHATDGKFYLEKGTADSCIYDLLIGVRSNQTPS